MSDASDDYIVNFTDNGTRRAESEARRAWNYVCQHEGCGQRFNRPCRLDAHMRSHNKERPFACPYDGCDKNFPRKDHLQRHLKNSHVELERSFVCAWKGCGKTFTSQGRLQRHMDVHDSKFYCTGYLPCNQVFRKQKTLDAHIKSQHLEVKPYPCTFVDPETNEQCTHGYQTENRLHKHVLSEHGEPKKESHFCMICIPPGTEVETILNEAGEIITIPKAPLLFPTQAELQAHTREVHPPTCPVCSLKFKDHSGLRSHFQTVHGDPANQPRYPCPRPGCGSVFNRKHNLNVHIQAVHDKQLKFFCTADVVSNSKHADLKGWNGENACGAPFKAKSSLEQHIRTHHLGLDNRKVTRKMAKPQKKNQERTALSLLTGFGYDEGRKIPCLDKTCEYRFHRNCDVSRHLCAMHNYSTEEAEAAILERDAMTGGQFWIGGLDEPMFADSTEPSMPQTPMPYFTDQSSAMQMQSGFTKPNDSLANVFDRSLDGLIGGALDGLDAMDTEDAELDAAMGLSGLPPAVDVHEGWGMLQPVQDFDFQNN
jgi:general transcription factor IIIA